MQDGLLPLFPLQVVLLPGAQLPLHIFEGRYKEMIGEVLRDKREFGVILASAKGIVDTGCSATVDRVLREYPDGRLDIMVRGRRRFEVLLLNEERSFLRGSVEFFDDDEPTPENQPDADSPDLLKNVIAGFNELQSLSSSDPLDPDKARDPQLSFRLAQDVPDLEFRQALLAMRNEAQRMRRIADFLPAYLQRHRRIQHTRDVAGSNGHGRKPGEPS
ncbi:MAG TPA: LON peptidase substrate-binding domain-containing protein [Bryobacteraceae bacterium]|nr:LON peptidase substrate-binding domain-containing protein [Bryobacteraceae bacterium]